MKKTFLATIFLFGVLAIAQVSSAQTTPVPAPEKPSGDTPLDVLGEETLDLEALKYQPLPIRRQIVSTQLDSIRVRLATIYDKTALALGVLSENKVDTATAQTELALASTSLADAKLTIDAMITASFDPENQKPIPVLVNGKSFKDTVLKAETELRSAREHIILALTGLKSAAATSTAANE